jgi:hypothetical protein
MFSYKNRHMNNPTQVPMHIPKQSSVSMSMRIPPKLSLPTTEPTTVVEPPKPKKMKWGEPTWFLFHSLAQKVKEEHFNTVKNELINTIYVICKNLPCPMCASHATQYMNSVNFNTIQTKKDLIDLLWRFHNEVNAKKNVPIFPYEQLEEKYSRAILINIIQLFMIHFKDKHASIRMIADDMYRQQIATKMQNWFRQNLQYFDY